jgi:hypothetical protein
VACPPRLDVTLAPIALFVYRRPEHSRRTIDALRACPEFALSPVVVYSDGPRDAAAEAGVAETRRVVREALPHARIVEAPANCGLAASIITGVDELTAQHGHVIVVEDDLVVDSRFLQFMNAALAHYVDVPQVMQVSGFQHAVEGLGAPVFLPMTTSWGWATWKRAWDRFDPHCSDADRLATEPDLAHRFDLDGAMPYSNMLARQIAGTIDSWAIRWYWTVFMANGLVLYPPQTLVRNDGFDGSGTHGIASVRQGAAVAVQQMMERLLDFPAELQLDPAAFEAVRAAARRDFGGHANVVFKVIGALRARLHRMGRG